MNPQDSGTCCLGITHCLKTFVAVWILLASALGQETEPASRIYAQASKSVFLIVVKSSTGELIGQATGFSVEGNLVVTNEHVIRAGTPYLDLGGLRVPLKVVAVDGVNDLAALAPEGEISSPPLNLAAIQPKPGTSVFVLGNPAGLEKSISTGVVAALRSLQERELIQISAPISPGSSGGPVLTADGKVVGVAVGMLEGGQNLNFAVPATFVIRLLKGDTERGDVPSLLSKAEELSTKRWKEGYSKEADSPFMRMQAQVEILLFKSLDCAGSDLSKLTAVADKALELSSPVAVPASERIVSAKPTALAYFRLARSLLAQNTTQLDLDPDNATLKKAEGAIRSAFKATRQPTVEMYAVLADILEYRSLYAESRVAFSKIYEMTKSQTDKSIVVKALYGLTVTSYALENFAESDRWFRTLVESGNASPWDWEHQAKRHFDRKDYGGAGDGYVQSAQDQAFWFNWCLAAFSYSRVTGAEDHALEAARECIKKGAGEKDSDNLLARAHWTAALVLNQRGVYEEALSHAREAAAIDPNNAFYQGSLADSFQGLRRFQEAIDASKQAIRLSDGKYAWMHFALGSAYFETENWQASRQAFEKAAQLDPKDDVAPYNVAICLVRLNFYRDAALWYEEALRRNPTHPQRQDILRRIQGLRK